jgi:hypothetical protein
MKKLIIAAVAATTIGVAGVAGSAAAGGKADGRCVATGVTTLGPAAVKAAATGQLPVSLSFVIKDHAFNGADATEGLLGITICE